MSILRFVLAVVLGMVVGSVVNMGLVMAGGHVIAPPAGADLTTAEGWQAAMPLLQPRHFLFPFLAHALGTLAGVRSSPPGSRRPASVRRRWSSPRCSSSAGSWPHA